MNRGVHPGRVSRHSHAPPPPPPPPASPPASTPPQPRRMSLGRRRARKSSRASGAHPPPPPPRAAAPRPQSGGWREDTARLGLALEQYWARRAAQWCAVSAADSSTTQSSLRAPRRRDHSTSRRGGQLAQTCWGTCPSVKWNVECVIAVNLFCSYSCCLPRYCLAVWHLLYLSPSSHPLLAPSALAVVALPRLTSTAAAATTAAALQVRVPCRNTRRS